MSYEKLDQPDVLAALFHPRKDPDSPTPEGAVDLDIQADEGVRIGARFHLAEPEAPHILFFHGNAEIVSDYDDIGRMFTEAGLSLLAVDYRGYGKSSGEPSASTMMRDAHIIFDEVKDWIKKQNRTGRIFIMGRSLGSASAIEVAASHSDDLAGLIIDSGFAQTLPLLLTLGIDIQRLGITEMDGFMNVQKITAIAKPTFFIHAQFDQLIPVSSAEILQSQSPAKNKEFQMVPGADHNTIFQVTGKLYFDTIKRFTDKVECVKPKRYVSRRK